MLSRKAIGRARPPVSYPILSLRGKQMLFEDLADGVSLDPATRLSGEESFALFGLREP